MKQLVGVFGWLDTSLGQGVYPLWQFPVAALFILAVIVGRAIDRWRLAVAVGGPVVLTSAIEALNAPSIGFVMQGRYILPALAAALLIAAWIVEHRGLFNPRQVRGMVRALALLTLPIQLYALVVAMVRFQHGLPVTPTFSDYNPFVGSWHPAVGSAAPILLATLGLAMLGVLVWRHAVPAPVDHDGPAEAGQDDVAAPPRLATSTPT
jgi:Predicted membrane protein (DUF2142)